MSRTRARSSSRGKKLSESGLALEDDTDLEVSCEQALRSAVHADWLDKRSKSSCCGQSWKRRFFVVQGYHLFRYRAKTDAKPTGIPLPLDGAQIYPRGDRLILISTMHKEHLLRAADKKDRKRWLQTLRQQKKKAVARELGLEAPPVVAIHEEEEGAAAAAAVEEESIAVSDAEGGAAVAEGEEDEEIIAEASLMAGHTASDSMAELD
eukprot:PLAT12842.1.p1 GENE.PLAT12842.1~~PLAT12842.1.p1  ORF type:complete len:208 (-),score=74.96 PLAT12842.1:62-685(-)